MDNYLFGIKLSFDLVKRDLNSIIDIVNNGNINDLIISDEVGEYHHHLYMLLLNMRALRDELENG